MNVNDLIGIPDKSTMCHDMFFDPFITCCFIDQKKIFVNLFENYTLTHYHFFYDLSAGNVIGEVHSKSMKGIMTR